VSVFVVVLFVFKSSSFSYIVSYILPFSHTLKILLQVAVLHSLHYMTHKDKTLLSISFQIGIYSPSMRTQHHPLPLSSLYQPSHPTPDPMRKKKDKKHNPHLFQVEGCDV
jgi:hypothetical protein